MKLARLSVITITLSIALFGALFGAVNAHADGAGSLRCEAVFANRDPEGLTIGSRDLSILAGTAASLTRQIEELATRSSSGSVYLDTTQILNLQLEEAIGAFDLLVRMGNPASSPESLSVHSKILAANQAAVTEKLEALEKVLKPSFWAKRLSSKETRDEKMQSLIDEIRVCRFHSVKCIADINSSLSKRKNLLSEIKNLNQHLADEVTVLSQAKQSLTQRNQLKPSDLNDAIAVIDQKIRQVASTLVIIEGLSANLEAEIRTAVELMDTGENEQRIALQALVVTGMTPDLLVPKDPATIKAKTSPRKNNEVSKELRDAFEPTVSDINKFKYTFDFLKSATEISDVDLMFILRNLPRGVDWGSTGDWNDMATRMKASSYGNWDVSKIHGGRDVRLMELALFKTSSQRSLSNQELSKALPLLQAIFDESRCLHGFNQNFKLNAKNYLEHLLHELMKHGK